MKQPSFVCTVERVIQRDGTEGTRKTALITEHTLRIDWKGKCVGELRCSPSCLRELETGYLCTMGYAHQEPAPAEETQRPVKREWIFRLADALKDGMPLHQKTFAAHAAMLMRDGEIMFRAEDIGRHNALDKAVGYALLNGIDLRDCILFSSGRIPSDMAEKAVRARVAAFAAKGAATDISLRIARESGLTLIGKARPDSFVLYNGCLAEQ